VVPRRSRVRVLVAPEALMDPSPQEALEESLRANFEAQGLWAVYADWLSEQDDARGELIRLERRLQSDPLSAEDRRRWVATHQEAWLHGWEPKKTAHYAWRHGFIVTARLYLNDFRTLLVHPVARFLREMGFFGKPPLDEVLEAISRSHVRLLDLSGKAAGVKAARLLASSEALRGLTGLDLSDNRLGDEGVRMLAESDALRGLAFLSLRHNHISADGVRALARSDTLRGLTCLDLSFNHSIDTDVVDVLAESDALRGLARLDLRNTWKGQWQIVTRGKLTIERGHIGYAPRHPWTAT
jgi:uncharacterized protein (TIGR02996 family)